MEIKRYLNSRHVFLFLVIVYFFFVHLFNVWIFQFSDIPKSDEYGLIFFTLGKCGYGQAYFYKFILHFISLFSNGFYEIFRNNFLIIHLILPMVFFSYCYLKRVSLEMICFLTTLLVLSPFNIIITRKLHFWEIAFFLFVLCANHFVKESYKRYFLLVSFLLLVFLRVESVFPLAVTLFIYFGRRLSHFKKAILTSFIFGIFVLCVFVFRNDMLKLFLATNSFNIWVLSLYRYSASVLSAIINMFLTYKIFSVSLIVWVTFYAKKSYKTPFTNSEFWIVLSLVTPFLIIRYNFLYNSIIFFILVFIVSYLLSVKSEKRAIVFVYLVSVLTLATARTNILESKTYYPLYTDKGQDYLLFVKYLEEIPLRSTNKITVIIDQDLSLLVPRKDLSFEEIGKLDSNFCDIFNKSRDYLFLPKSKLDTFVSSAHKCGGTVKYELEKELVNNLIFKKFN